VNASRFQGLGIGLLVVVGFVVLPIAIAIGFYTFATIQAILTGLDFSSQTLNVPLFLIVLVGTVTLFVVLVHAAVSFVGRSLSPKRRDEDAFQA
jgi:hypothetical protein